MTESSSKPHTESNHWSSSSKPTSDTSTKSSTKRSQLNTLPIQQAPPLPTPSPTPSPTPTRATTPAAAETRTKTRKRKGKQTFRSGQTPLTETAVPIETHPDEEVQVQIVNQESSKADERILEISNEMWKKDGEHQCTMREWAWFRGKRMWGAEGQQEPYSIRAIKKGEKYTINLKDVRREDWEAITVYEGMGMIGLPLVTGKRQRAQIAVMYR